MGKEIQQQTMIDGYILADQEEKKCKKDKANAKKELIGIGINEPGTYSGNLGDLVLSAATSPVIDATKVKKLLGEKKFMEVISVSMEKLKQHLAPADIDKTIVDTVTTIRWSAKPK